MAAQKKKKIKGLMNRGQARQLDKLGIDPGPSPAERAKKKKPKRGKSLSEQLRDILGR